MPDKFPDLGRLPQGPDSRVIGVVLPVSELKDGLYKSLLEQKHTFSYILAYADHSNPDNPRRYIRVTKNSCVKWLKDVAKTDTKVFLRMMCWTENGITFTNNLWSRAEE